ncbi:uncharacterized protein LOC143284740 [Babylonia areolata]|uniref:uncharacterized protein LOC143284740 n=1 Tax=Babylonia areolata TaxID=304850 RepID=UPI003FD3BA25
MAVPALQRSLAASRAARATVPLRCCAGAVHPSSVVACSVAKHAECSRVQKVSEAGPEQRQQMLDWLPHLNNDLSRLEGRHEMTSTLQLSLQARCQAANSHITQAANKAIQVVRAQEQRVRQAMEEEVEGLLKQHRQRQTANSRALQDVKALKTALEHCVTDTDLDLLRQAQCLKQRYVSVTEAVRTTAGDSEEEEDMDMGTFVPASSADLRSAVLVGTYHHYATVQSNTSPIPSPVVTSAVTSDSSTSCCQLEEGPVLHLETRSPSQPSAPPLSEHLLHESPLPLPESSLPEVTQESESTEAGPSTDDATSPSCSLSTPDLLSGHRGVTCHHASSFPAKVKGDRAEPLIRDMVVLSNGWLVATDTANRCVKRYFKTGPHDTKLHCKRLVLPHPPYGLCIVEGHLVAVTVPKERQLLLVMAMNHLVLSSTITLQEPAWAVGSLGEDRLAVTTCPHGEPGSVLILQMSGDSVQCVVRYSSQVSTPLYMAVTTDTHIVLTNPTSCQATCITSDTGHNVFHFHTSGKVMGVTCHSNVIALVDQSPALSLLTNQGRCLHTLILPKGKAGCSQPRAVAVATDSSVYVSDDGGRIHLFRFRWQQDPVTETSL